MRRARNVKGQTSKKKSLKSSITRARAIGSAALLLTLLVPTALPSAFSQPTPQESAPTTAAPEVVEETAPEESSLPAEETKTTEEPESSKSPEESKALEEQTESPSSLVDPTSSEQPDQSAIESPEGTRVEETPLSEQSPADIGVLNDLITPFAAQNQATITINAATIRGSSANLTGVTYRLHDVVGSGANTNPYRPGDPSNFFCSISAGQDSCTITVTGVSNQGGNNKSWFIVQTGNSSTYDVEQYRLGDFSTPTGVFYNVGRTVSLQSTRDYVVPSGSNQTRGLADYQNNFTRASTTALPLINPQIHPTCEPGLKVAIQMDISSSTDPYRTDYRTALHGLIDSLAGTGTNISLFTFGNTSPVSNRESAVPRNVDNAAIRQQIKADITTYTSDAGTQRTNWDAGFRRVAQMNNTHGYDLVLYITDGAPNVVWASGSNGYTSPNGNNVAVRSIDEAVLSANSLKNAGVRVATVGVGSGVTGEVRRNLQAVSGLTANSDYYVAAWSELQTYLQNIVAAANCDLPVTVSKTTQSSDGTVTGTDVAGWNFSAAKTASSNQNVTLTGANQQTSGSGVNGRPQWTLSFTEPSGQTGGVTLTETDVNSGYVFDNATCTVGGNSVAADVDQTARSVTIPNLNATSGQVHCEFINKEVPPLGALEIDKEFGDMAGLESDLESQAFSGTYSCELNNDEIASGTWATTGAEEATLTPASGTVAPDELPAGSECVATENALDDDDLPNESYAWGEPVIAPSSVEIVSNQTKTITVTNSVERIYGQFAVEKEVPEGSTTDDGMEFSGNWKCTLDEEVIEGTWGSIEAGDTWTSSEANEIPLGAECEVTSEVRPDHPVTGDPSYSWDGEPEIGDPVLAVALDTAPNIITVINKTLQQLGTVIWSKIDDAGDLLSGSEWSLQGPGTGGAVPVIDCIEVPCSVDVRDENPTGGEFELTNLAWGDYVLTETKAPAGHLLNNTTYTFTIGSTDPAKLEWDLGAIKNARREGPDLPLTGGIGRDFFTILGLSVLVLGIGTAGAVSIRNRRKGAA